MIELLELSAESALPNMQELSDILESERLNASRLAETKKKSQIKLITERMKKKKDTELLFKAKTKEEEEFIEVCIDELIKVL